MNCPDPNELNEILGLCITRLQNGQGLELVLAEHPDYAEQLRPILEAILVVWASRGSDTIPMAAMQRSRKRLLDAAAGLKQARVLPWWRRPFRLTGGVMIPAMTLLVCAVLLFTGIASAQALPGQPLYSVKLAAEQIGLAMPASPSDTLTRQENYDLRRKDEVEELLSQQHEQEVDLSGFLVRNDDGSWRIDDLKISISAAILPDAERLVGRYVAVHADLLGTGEMIAKNFEVRTYTISGKLTKIENGRIRVGDVWIEITPETKLTGGLVLGQNLRVSIVRMVGDSNVAMKIDQQGGSVSPESTGLNPSETPDAKFDSTETEVEVENSATPADRGGQEPQDTQEPEHRTEPTQPPEPTHPPEINDSPRATPSPTVTRKSDDSEEEHSTPKPTEKQRRRNTPTPTSQENRDGEHSSTQSPTQQHPDD